MVKRLYLLRHGRVDTGGRYIGSTDLPLLPEGREDLAELYRLIFGSQNIDSDPLQSPAALPTDPGCSQSRRANLKSVRSCGKSTLVRGKA